GAPGAHAHAHRALVGADGAAGAGAAVLAVAEVAGGAARLAEPRVGEVVVGRAVAVVVEPVAGLGRRAHRAAAHLHPGDAAGDARLALAHAARHHAAGAVLAARAAHVGEVVVDGAVAVVVEPVAGLGAGADHLPARQPP